LILGYYQGETVERGVNNVTTQKLNLAVQNWCESNVSLNRVEHVCKSRKGRGLFFFIGKHLTIISVKKESPPSSSSYFCVSEIGEGMTLYSLNTGAKIWTSSYAAFCRVRKEIFFN
jgi:hypothetical protein